MLPRWLIFTILALLSWGLWAIVSKLIGESVTAAQSQALSTIGLVPVMLLLAFSKKTSSPGSKGRGSLLAFIAGCLTCAGNVAYYHALNLGGKAATVVPLTALYPLVTILLALLFLRERLNNIQIAGMGLSFVAIYLFNITSMEGMASKWLLYALVPILLWGISGLVQKISTNHIPGELSALWFLSAFVPAGILILIFEPLSTSLSLRTWTLVAALGLFLSLGNFSILLAFASTGKASIIAPLAGLYPLVSVPIAIFFLGEKIGQRELAGIFVALLSVVALAWEKPGAASNT
ncbi:MAG: DMT family transporter [Verrucomicrobiota bacterium]|nr:DMT family transporter [Verrucomicrobiota bacterium]